jgi:FtsP/CotA-like multicopper oxidase with cupredoxin domain
MNTTHATQPLFSTDPTGLPAAGASETVELADGDTYELRIAPVANRIGDRNVRMIAYNGSVPGPTLRARQGSEIDVRVFNDGDHETTVHWHGLRLDNPYDGVPYETQPPIPVGGEFTYRLRFPDDGLYWYHPHVREDYGIEMGLYGNIVVDPADTTWPPVNREALITLDDVLVDEAGIAPFRTDGPTHTAMGRFGNVMLTAGTTDLQLEAASGEVVRLFLTNTANTRIFNVSVAGAPMKLIGGDCGRYEREELVDAVLLAPSERAIVDVLLAEAGRYTIEHATPERTYRLGAISVVDDHAGPAHADQFQTLHGNTDLDDERARLDEEMSRPADKTLVFDAEMPLLYGTSARATASLWTCPMHPDVISAEPGTCPQCGMKLIPAAATQAWTCPMHPEVASAEPGTCPQCGMKLVPNSEAAPADAHHESEHGGHSAHDHDSGDGLEWEDLMPEINAQTDATNMIWKLVDQDTGKANHAIDWSFRVGDRVKVRLVNTMDSDHPMHHPFHIHGAGRILVIARDDVPEANLVWKDTVLVRAGETVDIVLDVTSPGLWMAHCHIAEHNQNGMLFSFRVEPA